MLRPTEHPQPRASQTPRPEADTGPRLCTTPTEMRLCWARYDAIYNFPVCKLLHQKIRLEDEAVTGSEFSLSRAATRTKPPGE